MNLRFTDKLSYLLAQKLSASGAVIHNTHKPEMANEGSHRTGAKCTLTLIHSYKAD